MESKPPCIPIHPTPFSFETPKSENIAVGFVEGEVYYQSQPFPFQISKISPNEVSTKRIPHTSTHTIMF
jgi:hypothetical protein